MNSKTPLGSRRRAASRKSAMLKQRSSTLGGFVGVTVTVAPTPATGFVEATGVDIPPPAIPDVIVCWAH
jgi:hypothetical protein